MTDCLASASALAELAPGIASKRDLVWTQKRPITLSVDTCPKRDLVSTQKRSSVFGGVRAPLLLARVTSTRQKRPSVNAKET